MGCGRQRSLKTKDERDGEGSSEAARHSLTSLHPSLNNQLAKPESNQQGVSSSGRCCIVRLHTPRDWDVAAAFLKPLPCKLCYHGLALTSALLPNPLLQRVPPEQYLSQPVCDKRSVAFLPPVVCRDFFGYHQCLPVATEDAAPHLAAGKTTGDE